MPRARQSFFRTCAPARLRLNGRGGSAEGRQIQTDHLHYTFPSLRCCNILLENHGPATFSTHLLAHLLPARPVPLQVPVLTLHSCLFRTFRHKLHPHSPSRPRAKSGLNDQSGCKCQDSTTFFGGSQATTLPQTHSSPFAFTSYHRTPALGSIRMSLNGVPPTWCDAGHHDPIFSVNTRNARSMGTFTWRVRLTAAVAAV